MIGVYDFCGHYEWTFAWLEARGGPALLREYWDRAISRDSQRHAFELIRDRGFDGMREYWGHTLDEEAAGYRTAAGERFRRTDMHECPSKGFLIRNGLEQHADYCDHCMGWIGPMLARTGYVADHEHNHRGQCWWEMRAATDPTPPSTPGALSGTDDVRLRPDWARPGTIIDRYRRAQDPDAKTVVEPAGSDAGA